MCTKWFLKRLSPHSPLPHLMRLVCMEMNTNVPNFTTGSPFVETPPIEVPLYHLLDILYFKAGMPIQSNPIQSSRSKIQQSISRFRYRLNVL